MIDVLATMNPKGVTYLSTGYKPCVAEVQPSEPVPRSKCPWGRVT